MKVRDRCSEVDSASAQLIPRVVYSTIDKKRIRKIHASGIEEFRSNNPEYKFVLFDNEQQHDYVSSKFRGEKILDIFERSKFGVMRADIFRVALMLFEGGVCIDSSKRLRIPLKQTIPPTARFIFAHEQNKISGQIDINTDERIVNNHLNFIVCWCMMSCSGNPIYETMIEQIERDSAKFENIVYENPKTAILELTATYQYTKVVWKHLIGGFRDFHYAGIDFKEETSVYIPEAHSHSPFRQHYTTFKNEKILYSMPDETKIKKRHT